MRIYNVPLDCDAFPCPLLKLRRIVCRALIEMKKGDKGYGRKKE